MNAVCTVVAAETLDGEIRATREEPGGSWVISTPWDRDDETIQEPATVARIRRILRQIVSVWYPKEAKVMQIETRSTGDTLDDLHSAERQEAEADEKYRREALELGSLFGAALACLAVDDEWLSMRCTPEGRKILYRLQHAKRLLGLLRGECLEESKLGL